MPDVVPGDGQPSVRGVSVPHLELKDLRDDGYLQEVNRRFFHPLGLALAIYGAKHKERLVVLDYRDDPEGVRYDQVDRGKFERIRSLWEHRSIERHVRLGYVVQFAVEEVYHDDE